MAISGTMAATDPIKLQRAVVGVDIGATATFVSSETWIVSLDISGGDASTQTDYTLGGVGFNSTGNVTPYTITLNVVYTEGDTDLWYNLYQEHINETNARAVELQWNKEGGVTGDYRFTTSGATLLNCTPPMYDSGASGKVMTTATFSAPFPIAVADIPV